MFRCTGAAVNGMSESVAHVPRPGESRAASSWESTKIGADPKNPTTDATDGLWWAAVLT